MDRYRWRILTLVCLMIGSGSPARAAPASASVCSNLLAKGRAGKWLFRHYQHELKKSLQQQLKKHGWRGKKFVSVENLPEPGRSIVPQYWIRVDLESRDPKSPKVKLRNKLLRSPLKLDAEPVPELGACDLTLTAWNPEFLVNEDDVPMDIQAPILKATTRVYLLNPVR